MVSDPIHSRVGNPDAFLDVNLPKPKTAGRDLLVAVKAVSINPVDTKIRKSKSKDAVEDPTRVLDWDASRIVESVGPDVTLFKPGDEVYYTGDITRSGSNAEFQLVDERIVGLNPKSLGFAEAAALLPTTLTAYESFFDRLGIDRDGADKGQSVLIIGAGGGVGSISIRLAKAAGLAVIATASRPETEKWVRELGADHVVSHRNSHGGAGACARIQACRSRRDLQRYASLGNRDRADPSRRQHHHH